LRACNELLLEDDPRRRNTLAAAFSGKLLSEIPDSQTAYLMTGMYLTAPARLRSSGRIYRSSPGHPLRSTSTKSTCVKHESATPWPGRSMQRAARRLQVKLETRPPPNCLRAYPRLGDKVA
jgi:hypothetical protein